MLTKSKAERRRGGGRGFGHQQKSHCVIAVLAITLWGKNLLPHLTNLTDISISTVNKRPECKIQLTDPSKGAKGRTRAHHMLAIHRSDLPADELAPLSLCREQLQ